MDPIPNDPERERRIRDESVVGCYDDVETASRDPRLDSRLEPLDPKVVAALRRMSGAERLRIAFGLWRTAREITRCAERQRHPELDDVELERRVAERMSRGG